MLIDDSAWEGSPLHEATDDEATGGLAVGAKCTGLAALLDLIPAMPDDGRACAHCGGSHWWALQSPEGIAARGVEGRPITIVCPHCAGRGWTLGRDDAAP